MELRMIDGVENLSIDSIEKYLQQTGWAKGVSVNSRALPYEGPQDIYGKPITVVVPARKTIIDADRRINDVVRTVAGIESRSPESIVEAIAKLGIPRRVVAPKTSSKVVSRLHPRKQVKAEV